ncbi:MAG: spondin domain-containing protein [Pseudomonadota bacterium]
MDEVIDGGTLTGTADFSGSANGVTANVDGDGNGQAVEELSFSVSHDDALLASLTTDQTSEDLVAEALAGNLYYNIHTMAFPSGEIRGQLGTIVSDDTETDGTRTIVLSAALDASQEPDPPSDSEATGTGTVTITVSPGGEITYANDLTVNGIDTPDLMPVAGVSSIHLHNAPAGSNGPVITDIVQDAGGDVTGATADADADTGDGDVFAEETLTTELSEVTILVGSDQNDSLIASGAAGNEISGGAGDDFIAGGGGIDTLDGGEGNDTNSFSTIGVGVVGNLGNGLASYQTPSGVTVFESFSGFENLDGSAQDDLLTGDGEANLLTGNDGDDVLSGGGGGDTLEGGAGDDVLIGGGGSDVTDGGEGTDTASFENIGVAVEIDLSAGTGVYEVGGNAITDTISNVENVTGSANDDTLTGDDGDNQIAGGEGADIINGGDGADLLRGDALGSGTAISISVTNTLADGGTFLTPVWFGFHDGAEFDLFTEGEAASPGLERLAEDGTIEAISAEFLQTAGTGGVDGFIPGTAGVGGPIDPGETAVFTLDVDAAQVGQGFFTWVTMVIPSNDAFLAVPDDAMADPIFDMDGNFIGPLTIQRFGTDVLDAGTEANTEEDAAFLNQTAPDTGVVEGGVVGAHPGFNGSEGNPDATPANVLGGTTAPGAVIDPTIGDFTANGGTGQLLEIVIDLVGGSDDTLNGGAGDDTLEGGGGNDTFALDDGTGSDTVLDFEAGGDVLDVSAFALADLAAVQAAASEDAGNTTIALDSDDSVTLEGVALADLVADNFVFADAGAVDLVGDAGDNTLEVQPETVTVDGGAGSDTVVFPQTLGESTLAPIEGGFSVTSGDQTVAVSNTESFEFSDASLSVDTSETAAAVSRLFLAGLGRESDPAGAAFWTGVVDAVGLGAVADAFIASTEFTSVFGDDPDGAAFVEDVYTNILGREADDPGAAFWSAALESPDFDASDFLLATSESDEFRTLSANSFDDGVLLLA